MDAGEEGLDVPRDEGAAELEAVDAPRDEVPVEGCAASLVECGGVCVDLATDPYNCGSCAAACEAPYSHTEATCQNGECGTACIPGWEDRDGVPGCESACRPTGEETCNGLDDDCDGVADDPFECVRGDVVACLTTCRSEGRGTCTVDCVPPAPSGCEPPAETCNGLDDDCDGYIDEDFPPEVCDLCTPDCTGRVCGLDPVCGRVCGYCDTGDVCTVDGTCIPPCSPDCAGLDCGPDPACGLSCGDCEYPEECTAEGQCAAPCEPDCSGRDCGPDPLCGQSCGTCGDEETCDAEGQCIPPCTPDCSTRECGPDPLCGISCGTCTLPWFCNSAGQCDCTRDCSFLECGPDPVCGLSCGECTLPEVCNTAGMCVCTPDCSGRNCGPDPVCGVSCGECGTLEECGPAGVCVPAGCPPPPESCTTGTQNRRGCSRARVIGRTAAAAGSGYEISDSTCWAYNDVHDIDSGCWDAGCDHTYRIYMLSGETITVTADPWWDCDSMYSYFDMTIHIIRSTGCADLTCATQVFCQRYITSVFSHDYTATQDGWVFVIVDGTTAFDDEGDYDFGVHLTCRDLGCGCS
jgi:hypothetical protein